MESGARSVREPEERPRERGSRPWVVLLVLAAATLGAFLAPESWPDGQGRVRVELRDRVAIDQVARVGSTEVVAVRGETAGELVELELADGLPTDEPINAMVRVSVDGRSTRPPLEDVRVLITLPDGNEELIPVIRWDEEERVLQASRRPPQNAGVVLGLLGAVVVLWISELLPLFVTSLLVPVVLVFAGVAGATAALAPFFNPIIVLFFAGFLMAEAMRRSRLDHLAAIAIVARAGRSPAALFAAMLGVAAVLSMWMSNTAAVAVLVPIGLAVTEPLHHLGYRKAVVLGIAYAATIGGVGSAIGTPANQLAIEFLGTFAGRSISFAEWFAFGLPVVAVLLPVMGIYLWKRMGVTLDASTFQEVRAAARAELACTGRLARDQWVVVAVFVAVMGGWLTQSAHGFHPAIIALAGALLLAALGRIVPEDLQRISWASLLTFGGGLTLGLFLVETGTSDWVATRLTGLAGLPSELAIVIIALLALGLTTVASNTASAAILIPLAIPLAGVLGIDPVLLVAVVAVTSSIDFALVVGTPPTMIAYSTRLYTAGQIFRIGIVLDLLAVGIVAAGVVWIWRLLGIV